MGKRGPKPKSIGTTWTAELAYVVGIFASDGNLGKDGMYLDVTSVDIETVQTVKRILKLEKVSIGTKSSGAGTFAYRLQFKRVLFHQWLRSIGLTPDKSKTIGRINVPDEYFFDFLRGVWDGDGCIYSYFDPRWKSSYAYYISIVSASPIFIQWLQETNERLVGIKGHVSQSGRSTVKLNFAKRDSKAIFNAMFYATNVAHLPRKFAKAQKIFRIDEANTQKRLVT